MFDVGSKSREAAIELEEHLSLGKKTKLKGEEPQPFVVVFFYDVCIRVLPVDCRKREGRGATVDAN